MTVPMKRAAPSPYTIDLDGSQFNGLLREMLPGLSRYAVSLSRNQTLAEDLVQETAARAWRNRESFIVGTNFKAWMYRILRNCFLSHVRHGRVAKTDTYGDDFPDVAVASSQEASIFLKDVEECWGKLAPSQQRAIELIGVEGRSYEEAAAMEDISIGTLKSRVSRGRQILLAMINGDVPARQIKPSRSNSTGTVRSVDPETIDDAEESVRRAQIDVLQAWRQRSRGRSEAA